MNGRRYRRSPDRTKKSVKENVALPEASEILSYRDKSLDMSVRLEFWRAGK
ncbi:Hypothetical predicted protein, partial [Paramuricea clavata]